MPFGPTLHRISTVRFWPARFFTLTRCRHARSFAVFDTRARPSGVIAHRKADIDDGTSNSANADTFCGKKNPPAAPSSGANVDHSCGALRDGIRTMLIFHCCLLEIAYLNWASPTAN